MCKMILTSIILNLYINPLRQILLPYANNSPIFHILIINDLVALYEYNPHFSFLVWSLSNRRENQN